MELKEKDKVSGGEREELIQMVGFADASWLNANLQSLVIVFSSFLEKQKRQAIKKHKLETFLD